MISDSWPRPSEERAWIAKLECSGEVACEPIPLHVKGICPIEFALLSMKVQGKPLANPDRLVSSLVEVLKHFDPLAGRIMKRDDQIFALSSNAGVPVSWCKFERDGPEFNSPLDGWLFDSLRPDSGQSSPSGGHWEEPVMRIRISDFEDGQVIAFSVCSVAASTATLGAFITAWSHAFDGKEFLKPKRPIEFNSDGCFENIVHANISRDFTQACEPRVAVCWVRSKEDGEGIIERYLPIEGSDIGVDETRFQELLCAEAMIAQRFQGDAVALVVVKDTVANAGKLGVELSVQNSIAAAADLQRALGVANLEQTGEVETDTSGAVGIEKQLYIITMWLEAFKLTKLRFGEDVVEDFMLGKSLFDGSAMTAGSPRLCWLLPQRMGCVKLVTCMPRSIGEAFVLEDQKFDALSVATCTALEA